MPIVTALRAQGGSVAVELDGSSWRVVPLAAAADAHLTVGCELDRERARALGRALRRARARDTAVRAVARREHSRASLDDRLARAGVRPRERGETVAAAERAGLVDDARFAEARAGQLAARGAGDLMILADLGRQGVADAVARAAVAGLDPEQLRAARIVEARGATASTLRHLAAKGFSEEALERLVAELESGALG